MMADSEMRASSESPTDEKIEAPMPDIARLKMQKTAKFDMRKLEDRKYEHYDVVKTIHPKEFNMDYYHKDGLSTVLLFDCKPTDLGMKVPPADFTPRKIMKLIGEERSVKFFIVEAGVQQTFSTSMLDFVTQHEQNERERTCNVISLEVSGTRMVDLLKPPELVRLVDLGLSWPDERKQRRGVITRMDGTTTFDFANKYPRVEHYCLMSPAGSYTSFHTDFHGSSVWYHVFKGQKVFFLIPPTDVNIKKFEKHMRDQHDFSFFGDLVEKCTRVVVNAGQTVILPAGWIHAVYTPEESLVFGGNFIHARSLRMQCRIVRHERKLKLKKNEKYPFYDEVFFFAMDKIVKESTGRAHIRPTSRNRQKDGLQYVGEEFIGQKFHHRIPQQKDFDTRNKKAYAWKEFEETEEYTEMRKIFGEYDNEEAVENYDVHNFLVKEHPLICYHPESFGIEKTLKNLNENPCNLPPPSRFDEEDAKMQINDDILRQQIHSTEIAEWEAFLTVLRRKKHVKLPEGLTRPNLLIHSFIALLERRRHLAEITKSEVVARALIDRTNTELNDRRMNSHENYARLSANKKARTSSKTIQSDQRSSSPDESESLVDLLNTISKRAADPERMKCAFATAARTRFLERRKMKKRKTMTDMLSDSVEIGVDWIVKSLQESEPSTAQVSRSNKRKAAAPSDDDDDDQEENYADEDDSDYDYSEDYDVHYKHEKDEDYVPVQRKMLVVSGKKCVTPSTTRAAPVPRSAAISTAAVVAPARAQLPVAAARAAAAAASPAAGRAPLPAAVEAALARANSEVAARIAAYPVLAAAVSRGLPAYTNLPFAFSKDEIEVATHFCLDFLREQRGRAEYLTSPEHVVYVQSYLPHRPSGAIQGLLNKLQMDIE